MTALVSPSTAGRPSVVGPSSVSAVAIVNGSITAAPRLAVQTLKAGPCSISLPSPTTACAVHPSSVPGAAAFAATAAIWSIRGRWWTEKNRSVSCGASPSSEPWARLRASSAASSEFALVDRADPMRICSSLYPPSLIGGIAVLWRAGVSVHGRLLLPPPTPLLRSCSPHAPLGPPAEVPPPAPPPRGPTCRRRQALRCRPAPPPLLGARRPQPGLGHPPELQRPAHLLGGQESPGDNDLPQRPPGRVGLLRHLGRGVVADQRHEGGDDHERSLQQLLRPPGIGLDALDAALGEQPGRSAQALDREEEIVGHQRHHRVELEHAAEAPERDRSVVADHLGGD